MLRPGIVATVARQELRVLLRTPWVAVYAMVFTVLTLSVSYFGLAVMERVGLQEFDRTAVSLLNLVLYIVPLATMLMAVQSFRAEGGTTEQLLAEPVGRAEIVVGKLLGLSAGHLLATLLGFGFTGIVVGVRVGNRGLSAYLALVAFTVLLGVAFLSLSAMLTILSRRGGRAYAVVLVSWFVLVLLYDLVVIGLAFVLPEWWANRLALVATFLNPIDACRVAALLAISGKELFGAAGAQLVRMLGGVPQAIALLIAALLGWIVLLTTLGAWSLDRQDI